LRTFVENTITSLSSWNYSRYCRRRVSLFHL